MKTFHVFPIVLVTTNSLFSATLWGTGGANTAELYEIEFNGPNRGVTVIGHDLPNAPRPGNGVNNHVYQAVTHYRSPARPEDIFFMTSFPGGSIASQVATHNAQTHDLTAHIYLRPGNLQANFDLSSLAGYDATWFDRGPGGAAGSKPWLNSGGGYYDGSIYITTEYATSDIGGGNQGFYTYPFLLRIDLDNNNLLPTSITRLGLNPAAEGMLALDPQGRRTFGDVGDLDFIERTGELGQFVLTGTAYNGGSGSGINVERTFYTGSFSDLQDGQFTIDSTAGSFTSPQGLDGLAEVDGVFYATGVEGSNSYLYEVDPVTGALSNRTLIDESATDFPNFLALNDLTSSYEPVPEPSTALLALSVVFLLPFRRRA